MKKLLAILLSVVLVLSICLTGCGRKTTGPQPIPEPSPAPMPEQVPQEPIVIEPEPEKPKDPNAADYTISSNKTTETWDNINVSIDIPVLFGENLGALNIINNYYLLLQGKVLDYAEGDLNTDASAGVTANFQVTYSRKHLLSILWYVNTILSLDAPVEVSYSAATFDPTTGNLITFQALFTDPDAVRGKFVEKARETMEVSQGTYPFYEQWYELADSALDTDNFYLTEDSVYMFYTQDAIGTFLAVPLTYDELGDLLKVKP